MTSPARCPLCSSDNPNLMGPPCSTAEAVGGKPNAFHSPPKPPDVEQALDLIELIAAERAAAVREAVKGMHILDCRCDRHDELCWHHREGDGCPMIDPRCIAARKRSEEQA